MLGNLIKKEIKELLTPSSLAVIIGITILFASMGKIIGVSKDEAKKKPKIALVDQDKTSESKALIDGLRKKTDFIYEGDDSGLAIAKVRKHKKAVAMVMVPRGFSKDLEKGNQGYILIQWVMRGAGIMDTIGSAILEKSMEEMNRNIAFHILHKQFNIKEDKIKNILIPTKKLESTLYRDKLIPVLSPNKIAQVLISQSMTIPMAIFIILMLGGSMVITSMGLEKENKTLETLLTMPVNRTTIVMGKLLGSAIVGLIMAALYLVGFKFYLSSLEAGTVNLAALGLSLSIFDYLLVGLSLFVSLVFGLAMAMLLGIMARDYKSAQILTYPIMGLAIIPMFFTMYKDLNTVSLVMKYFMYAIPFTHPMTAMRSLTFDAWGAVVAGIVYNLILSGILIAVIVKIFKTDKLITGIMQFRKN
ncbi:ABC transporter permease [Myxococcota bacterium]|nr:ABC transporter permease [Myxococcota bacterium]MBU1379198.1 ABC transporter permease [Myxococcota bacterium]MBU1496231.1 ABC transporter permease [Myxococcota bacterium]